MNEWVSSVWSKDKKKKEETFNVVSQDVCVKEKSEENADCLDHIYSYSHV